MRTNFSITIIYQKKDYPGNCQVILKKQIAPPIIAKLKFCSLAVLSKTT